MDLLSRLIIGWATRPTLRRELVRDAVLMAGRRRRPRDTVIPSNQGCQYRSDDWRRFRRTNSLEPSMSRRSNCWDNAVAESFFASLSKELIRKRIYKNREPAAKEVSEYIESLYNRARCHQKTCGSVSGTLNRTGSGDVLLQEMGGRGITVVECRERTPARSR